MTYAYAVVIIGSLIRMYLFEVPFVMQTMDTKTVMDLQDLRIIMIALDIEIRPIIRVQTSTLLKGALLRIPPDGLAKLALF
jgi:hypothetical protein